MNNGSIIVIIATAIAIIAVAGAAIVLSDGDRDDDDGVTTITYVLNGGVQNPLNPTEYEPETETSMKCPGTFEKGKYFGGWYMDEDFTQLCMCITPDMKDDVTLYAKWQDNRVGISLDYTITSESSYEGGELEIMKQHMLYCGYRDSTHESYVKYDYKYTFEGETFEDCAGEWVSDPEHADRVKIGEESIDTFYGTRLCTVFKEVNDGIPTKVWTDKELNIDYKAVDYAENETTTILCTGYTVEKPPETAEIKVYAGEGLSVTGSGTYAVGETVTLTVTAEEDEFGFWTDDWFLWISDERTIEVEVEWADRTFYAIPGWYYQVTPESDDYVETEMPGDDLTWTLYYEINFAIARGTSNIVEYGPWTEGWYFAVFEDSVTGFRGVAWIICEPPDAETSPYIHK